MYKNNFAKTVMSREYSLEWRHGDECYYLVNDEITEKCMRKKAYADKEKKVISGGRLGEYKYRFYDVNQVIDESLNTAKEELNL